MNCKICTSEMTREFGARILGKYDIAYFSCAECGFLCTEKPYWLDESYTDAIVASDTGVVSRNVNIARRLAAVIYFMFPNHGCGQWLDFAGGYGMLTRMMRDFGFDFYWSDKYSQNLYARGFEAADDITCVGATAFEAIEHSENPKSFVEDILAQTRADSFVFTTELFAGKPPAPGSWWYYGLNTGQHISFFQEKTLQKLADQLGFHYYRAGNFHFYSRRPVNRTLFRFLTGRVSALLAPVIRRLQPSRLEPDHRWLAGRALGDTSSVAGR
jgi:hypothetical protein